MAPNPKGFNQHHHTWKGATCVVRVPTDLKERLLKIARHLDTGGDVILTDLFTPAPKPAAPVKIARKRGTQLARKKVVPRGTPGL
jgi:hypothetical protein